jgi:hypothetical protein
MTQVLQLLSWNIKPRSAVLGAGLDNRNDGYQLLCAKNGTSGKIGHMRQSCGRYDRVAW